MRVGMQDVGAEEPCGTGRDSQQPQGRGSQQPQGRNAFAVLLQGQRLQQALAQHFFLERRAEGDWHWQWWSAGSQTAEQEALRSRAKWSAAVAVGDADKAGAAGRTTLHLHTNVVSGEGGTPTWQAPLVSNAHLPHGAMWRGGAGVLKSALQKNVRLCRGPCAVRCALWLLKEDAGEVLRRLVVVCVEDALLHPAMPMLVWLMAAQGKGYQLGRCHSDAVLQLSYQLAAVRVHDHLSSALHKGWPTLHSYQEADQRLPPAEAALVKCLLLRASFGGMAGDVTMLKEYASYWAARFNGMTAGAPLYSDIKQHPSPHALPPPPSATAPSTCALSASVPAASAAADRPPAAFASMSDARHARLAATVRPPPPHGPAGDARRLLLPSAGLKTVDGQPPLLLSMPQPLGTQQPTSAQLSEEARAAERSGSPVPATFVSASALLAAMEAEQQRGAAGAYYSDGRSSSGGSGGGAVRCAPLGSDHLADPPALFQTGDASVVAMTKHEAPGALSPSSTPPSSGGTQSAGGTQPPDGAPSSGGSAQGKASSRCRDAADEDADAHAVIHRLDTTSSVAPAVAGGDTSNAKTIDAAENASPLTATLTTALPTTRGAINITTADAMRLVDKRTADEAGGGAMGAVNTNTSDTTAVVNTNTSNAMEVVDATTDAMGVDITTTTRDAAADVMDVRTGVSAVETADVANHVAIAAAASDVEQLAASNSASDASPEEVADAVAVVEAAVAAASADGGTAAAAADCGQAAAAAAADGGTAAAAAAADGGTASVTPWLQYLERVYGDVEVPSSLASVDSAGALFRSDVPFSAVDFHCSDVLAQLLATPEVQRAAAELTCKSWGIEGDVEWCLRTAMWLFRSSTTPKRWLFDFPPSAPQQTPALAGRATAGGTALSQTDVDAGTAAAGRCDMLQDNNESAACTASGETDFCGGGAPVGGGGNGAGSVSALNCHECELFAVRYDQERDDAVRERLKPLWDVAGPFADRYSQNFIARRFRSGG